MSRIIGNLAKLRTGHLAGERMAGERDAALAQQQAEQQRAEQDRQRQIERDILQKRLLERQINAPQTPTRGTPDYLQMLRDEASVGPPKPPVRGTPEYESMLGREASIEAKHRPPSAAQTRPPSEGERRGAALYAMAKDAFPTVMGATAPNRGESYAAKIGLNEALSADRQQIEQAAGQLVSSYLYFVSGATATDEEIQRRARELVPQPGDKPETIARKQQAARTMMHALEIAAGRAGPAEGAPSQASGPAAPPADPMQQIEAAAQKALQEGADPAVVQRLRAQAIAKLRGAGGGGASY